MKRWIWLLVVLSACGGGGAGSESDTKGQSITGTMTMITGPADADYDRNPAVGGSCEGSGGFDDIRSGASVVVRNEDGTTIASGRLEPGEITSVYKGTIPTCEWAFEVRDVPAAEFYEIEVSHRGGLQYSKAEMEEMNWEVAFSISTT